jgi:hypothetical protein
MKHDYQAFFAEWKDWSKFDECEPRFNEVNGVYAFRMKTPFGRLHGSSQVLYIGMCDQNGKVNRRPGLWHRLRNYKQRNNGASERLTDLVKKVGDTQVEYSYVPCASPREIEKGLLTDYYKRHLELPPLNRSK